MSDVWGNERLRGYSNKAKKNLNGSRILFAVGSLAISGGTNLIFQYAKELKDAGAEVTLAYMLGSSKDADWHNFGSLFRTKPLTKVGDEMFDLAIATWWPTIYELPKINASRFLYFVQSLESRFALNSSDRWSEVKAAGTYLFDIPMVTVASWLQNLLISETRTPTWFVRNGVDKTLFPIADRPKTIGRGKPIILVEGSLGVGMKAVDQTLEMLRYVEGIEVWHVTPEKRGGSPSADKIFEKVPISKMSEIYSQASLFVKMSRVEGMFGPPLEAFHSGTPGLFGKVTGFDEYLVDDYNCKLVEVDDFENAINNIRNLVSDRELYSQLSSGALETARQWPSMKDTSTEFLAACFAVLHMNFDSTLTTGKIKKFEGKFSEFDNGKRELADLVPPALLAQGI